MRTNRPSLLQLLRRDSRANLNYHSTPFRRLPTSLLDQIRILCSRRRPSSDGCIACRPFRFLPLMRHHRHGPAQDATSGLFTLEPRCISSQIPSLRNEHLSGTGDPASTRLQARQVVGCAREQGVWVKHHDACATAAWGDSAFAKRSGDPHH